MILNYEGWTATDAKCAHMASAEARFTTSTKISVRTVPRSIVLNGYKGEAHPWQGGYIATFFENCIEDRQ